MKKILTALACLLPFKLSNLFLKILGHKITWSAKIGFSLILSNKISLEENTCIGHLNFIKNEELNFKKGAYIGHLNRINGPFKIFLKEKGAIGNKNSVVRAPLGVTYEISNLTLGKLSKLTSNHYIDLTRSIYFGDYSTLAGIKSQLWTHGYYHANTGKDRIRIDGQITIGDNVYIGSGCIFNPGVTVANAIHIGGGSVISKNLSQSGMYVGQALRYIENDIDSLKNKLIKVEGVNLIEKVYSKKQL